MTPPDRVDAATLAVQEALFDLSLAMDRIDHITKNDARFIARRAVAAADKALFDKVMAHKDQR